MTDNFGMNVPSNERRIPQKRIEQTDKLYWDPSERAMGVLNIIESVRQRLIEENKQKHKPEDTDVPSQWDILCFACEHVARMSVTMEDEELEVIARKLVSWLYSTHYSYPGKIYGAPDRPRGEEKSADDPTWEPSADDTPKGLHRDAPEGDRTEGGDSVRSDSGHGVGDEESSGPG